MWRAGPIPSCRLLVAILFFAALAGCTNDPDDGSQAPEVAPRPSDPEIMALLEALAVGRDVIFVTDLGEIRLLLYDSLMPQTAGRFAELIDQGFYESTLIHRVVDDFVIQGGDPSGTGQLGSGQTIPFERDARLHYGGGAMGLARDLDPDSGDSQWFITERPAPHLHDPQGTTGAVFGAYALYAQVYAGLDVVRQIASVAVAPGLDRPLEDVHLQHAETGPPPQIDLLQWPRVIAVGTAGPFEVIVERPLYLFDGHPAWVRVYLEANAQDAPAPPPAVTLAYGNGSGDAPQVPTTLEARSDDGAVYEGFVTIRGPGATDETVAIPRHGDITNPVTVHPWSEAYAIFDRTP